MQTRISQMLKNVSYTFLANIVNMIVTGIFTLIVPKLIGTEDYGYWQLYLFYTSYVGFFHLGWCDGVYLRYGGNEYSTLNKAKFVRQFWMLFLLELTIGAIVLFLASSIRDTNRLTVLVMVVFYGLIVNPRYFLLFVLQGTNLIKQYAKILLLDRILYCMLTGIFLAIGKRNYEILICADLLARIISMIYSIYICRAIVFGKMEPVKRGIDEAKKNISAGSKLMFANIAGNLIVGIVRLGIEQEWSIETFGKISLTISVSNLLMTFISAVAIVLFPMLRRTNFERLQEMYGIMRTLLMVSALGLLIFFYPLKEVLSLWLPQYAESFHYMVLLFPICVFECKVSMLINTYLKTLRKEKWILLVNVISVALSILATSVTVFVLRNLTFVMVAIVILLAFKSIYAEMLLSKVIKVTVIKDIFYEVALASVFMYVGWTIDSWISVAIYTACYLIYLFLKKADIRKAKSAIKYAQATTV